jgi:NitT/TauT family transport system permease protein
MTREQFSTFFHGVGAFIGFLLIWELSVRAFEVPAFFVPAPTDIFKALVNSANLYLVHLGMTVYSTLVGFLVAFVLAVIVAALISEIRFLERTVYPILIGFQAMPRIALAPIIIVWFGYGSASKIALGALSAFFPIFLNMLHGLKIVDNDQIALMRTLRATPFQIFYKIKVPAALPFLLAGANIGIIFSMLGVIVGEFLGANIGMGYLIVNQSALLDTAGVFATAMILSAVGLIFHFGVQHARFKLLFWARRSEISGGSNTN